MDNEIVKVDNKKKETNKKINIPYKFIIVLVILLILVISIPTKKIDIFSKSNYSKIEKISNLATVEAYYHNVAAKEVDASKLGKVFGNIGYKKYWVEYDGTVEFGIDAKEVRIYKPDKNNVVKVYIPEAKMIGKPIVIQNSISDPITDTGFLTKIPVDDKTEAIAETQKSLEETASKDKELINLAYERAKLFFEKYIINAGHQEGKEYTVEFINK